MKHFLKILLSSVYIFITFTVMIGCNRIENEQGESKDTYLQEVYLQTKETMIPNPEIEVQKQLGNVKFVCQNLKMYRDGAAQKVVVFNDKMDEVTNVYLQIYSFDTQEWRLIPANQEFDIDNITYKGIGMLFADYEGELFCFLYDESEHAWIAQYSKEGDFKVLMQADDIQEKIVQMNQASIFRDANGALYVFDEESEDAFTETTLIVKYDQKGVYQQEYVCLGKVSGFFQMDAQAPCCWYGVNKAGFLVRGVLGDEQEPGNLFEATSTNKYFAVDSKQSFDCYTDLENMWIVTETEALKVLNWIERGYYWNQLFGLICHEDGRVEVMGQLDGEIVCVEISFTEQKTMIDVQEIIIALPLRNVALEQATADFNRNSAEYRITFVYPDESESMWDFRDKIQTEIGIGQGPDMIADELIKNPKEWATKGYVVSLDNRVVIIDDIYSASLASGRFDGQLYAVPYDFTLDFISYRNGDMEGVTTLDVLEFSRRVNESDAIVLQKEVGGAQIIYDYFLSDVNNPIFIDWQNGRSHLTDQAFLDVIEFSKKYADNMTNEAMTADDYFSVNSGIIGLENIDGMRNIYEQLNGDVCMLGYPRQDGIGSYMKPRSFYVNSASAHKEGAFVFLNYLLEEATQTKYAIYDINKNIEQSNRWFLASGAYFPVNKKALSTQIDYARKKEEQNSYLADDGTFVYVNPPITDEQVERLLYLVENARGDKLKDEVIYEILYDELELYYSGDITAKEVAEKIQNRVQLYLDEQ